MARLNADKEVPILISKMLENKGVDYDFIMKNQQIDGVNWFQYYTWTEEEEEAYKKWFLERLTKVYRFKKAMAEKEYAWFSLMWGLKRSDWV